MPSDVWLQQRLPLAVLKHVIVDIRVSIGILKLQQRLPLAVLKRITETNVCCVILKLQQRLPLAVLKPPCTSIWIDGTYRCNSAYRLRY